MGNAPTKSRKLRSRKASLTEDELHLNIDPNNINTPTSKLSKNKDLHSSSSSKIKDKSTSKKPKRTKSETSANQKNNNTPETSPGALSPAMSPRSKSNSSDSNIQLPSGINSDIFKFDMDRVEIEDAEIIGTGASAYVQKGLLDGERIVAVKFLYPTNTKDNQFINEVIQLDSVRHPCIMELIGADISGVNRIIVTEYLPLGALDELLFKDSNDLSKYIPLDWELALLITNDVCQGMNAIHEKNIIHRDLKPNNVLIASLSRDKDVPRAKICDFGMATISQQDLQMTVGVGTPMYMAPELYERGILNYDKKVDVFAFGMLFWQVVCRQKPFAELRWPVQVANAICKGERPPIPSNIPSEIKSIISSSWAQCKKDRPFFDQILETFKEIGGPKTNWTDLELIHEILAKKAMNLLLSNSDDLRDHILMEIEGGLETLRKVKANGMEVDDFIDSLSLGAKLFSNRSMKTEQNKYGRDLLGMIRSFRQTINQYMESLTAATAPKQSRIESRRTISESCRPSIAKTGSLPDAAVVRRNTSRAGKFGVAAEPEAIIELSEIRPQLEHIMCLIMNRLEPLLFEELKSQVSDGDTTSPFSVLPYIREPYSRNFWENSFGSRAMIVKWDEFLSKLKIASGRGLTGEEKVFLKSVLDGYQTNSVTVQKFASFAKWFSPVPHKMLEKIDDLLMYNYFHPHISYKQTEQLLKNQPPGTYLIRFSSTIPGSFTGAFVTDDGLVHQISIEPVSNSKLQVADQNEQFFSNFEEIKDAFSNLLKYPLPNPQLPPGVLVGEMSFQDTREKLKGQAPGTYIVRLSQSEPGAYVFAYVTFQHKVEQIMTKYDKRRGKFYVNGEPFNSLREIIIKESDILRKPFASKLLSQIEDNFIEDDEDDEAFNCYSMVGVDKKPQKMSS